MTSRIILPALLAIFGFAAQTALGSNTLKVAVNPGHLMDTTQFGYSQATVVEPSAKTIYIAGQIGVSEGETNDFESQVDRAFDNLLSVLDEAGGHATDIVKITVLIKDHDADRLAYLVKKRRDVFGENPPASTLIPVTALALESIEFEIDAIAVTQR